MSLYLPTFQHIRPCSSGHDQLVSPGVATDDVVGEITQKALRLPRLKHTIKTNKFIKDLMALDIASHISQPEGHSRAMYLSDLQVCAWQGHLWQVKSMRLMLFYSQSTALEGRYSLM